MMRLPFAKMEHKKLGASFSRTQVGLARLASFEMPNSGKPEFGREKVAPPIGYALRTRSLFLKRPALARGYGRGRMRGGAGMTKPSSDRLRLPPSPASGRRGAPYV